MEFAQQLLRLQEEGRVESARVEPSVGRALLLLSSVVPPFGNDSPSWAGIALAVQTDRRFE